MLSFVVGFFIFFSVFGITEHPPSKSSIANMSSEAGGARPLPKFGEWDVNNPSSAESFTVIFNKARDQKKTNGSLTGGSGAVADAEKNNKPSKNHKPSHNHHPKKVFMCFYGAS